MKILNTVLILLILFTLVACKKSDEIKENINSTTNTSTEETKDGFYIKNGKLYDVNNNEFIMRGINYPEAWYQDKLNTSLEGIENTGSNTIRIVLSSGEKFSGAKTSLEMVKTVIEKAKAHKLIVVLEIHDTTGYGESGSTAISLTDAVDYWLEIKSALIGEEKYVLLNIGNEPIGNITDSSGSMSSDTAKEAVKTAWTIGHKEAIETLRSNGIMNTIIVDAPNWGTDYLGVMKENSDEVFNSDTEKNTMFSVHMYQTFNTEQLVYDYLKYFENKSYPIIVGEFGLEHMGYEVAGESIMQKSTELGIGYLGWSWKGNDSSTASLDITNDWAGTSYTNWGNTLINGTNGIKATSKLCSVFN